MARILKLTLASLFAASLMFSQAHAASDCEAKAVSKDGKPLAGAAKAASIKKCEAESKVPASACAEKAVDKNGKALAGAAKNAFMKKCEADAKGGK
ncbi:MAG: hypothetical protein K9K38_18660 [Rhodoferax sp.]|nr:hypothetical protein [Rhodoferax sp.]